MHQVPRCKGPQCPAPPSVAQRSTSAGGGFLFRAWRRGVREMDLIMGRFADAYLPTMNEDELAEFERLLDVPDPQALAWIIGGERPPREFDTPLFARLCGSR